MARSAAQNDSFCRAKWAVFACKMSHFESPKNVKKTQVVCSQYVITFSYFAHTRPPVFYFGKMACISYNKCYFVSIIQHLHSHHLQRGKAWFLHHFPIPTWRMKRKLLACQHLHFGAMASFLLLSALFLYRFLIFIPFEGS